MPGEVDPLLKKANKQIADLKEDIRRLSDELQKKNSLSSSYMDLASEQSKQISSLGLAAQDTALWDPPHLSSAFILLDTEPPVVLG